MNPIEQGRVFNQSEIPQGKKEMREKGRPVTSFGFKDHNRIFGRGE